MEPSVSPSPSWRAWLEAARPRTLPLALASILLGSFLAAARAQFNGLIFGLAVLTTVFLQILSNLANDWGDSIHGADSLHREGPQRAVQTGHISSRAMRNAVILFSVLSFASGITLLLFGIDLGDIRVFWGFLALGLVAIAAAIAYTSGPRPYGYAGLGDISVLIFFGWVGVLGTYYLHAQHIEWADLLPASACGLFAAAVLNVNNIRDIHSDRLAGKFSIPVRLGPRRARVYHWALLGGGMVCAVVYVLQQPGGPWQWLFLLSFPLLVRNGVAVWQRQRAAELDPLLKQMALSTLLFVVTFGLGQLLAA
ncbi:1,4-dihydroxy-2-naphthoate octaprenyltransferase [Catalinimonas alkaloidigena]|uniref:1,4-dihydroxy-2-naphthoate octaprenyltransferase n=1 Tax=Catalinimonas alkaloidigena TaxID=1075417 RepID=A0A1G8XP82_9BACT|nr:1,4-dihydroxy-2-naphthoate polyprenyltransferase [Catalinimonas alkaloidigena]SDJ92287.1 1,4-dihydroxy-2-naphthoate octaprenyltransferase [Catalinimonas alkaloidigena]